MALLWDDITAVTHQLIVPNTINIVYKSSPLLIRLRTRMKHDFTGGRTIVEPISYAQVPAGAFGRGATFGTTPTQTETGLEFKIAYYRAEVSLYGTDVTLNMGPNAVMNFATNKMINAAGAMGKALATDLPLHAQNPGGAGQTNRLTGGLNSGQFINGLSEAIDDGRATPPTFTAGADQASFPAYGSITRTDLSTTAVPIVAGTQNAGINGYVKDFSGGVQFTMGAFLAAYGSCWFGSEHPDLTITTQLIWNILENSVLPEQRFTADTGDLATVGFQSLRILGTDVAVDQYVPAGALYMLNTKYIKFWVSTHPLFQFGFTGWKETASSIDVAGQYLFGGNLVVKASRLMAKLIGIGQ